MWSDFKKFLQRGNVLDLAVAVVLGAAFGKIVTTMVEGVIMPPIGYLIKGVDFSKLYFDPTGQYSNLQDPEAIQKAIQSGAPLIMYGQLITDLIQFVIVAFVIFLIARYAVRAFSAFEAEESGPSKEVELLTEIRDALQTK
jgi:large conductance mechanosensitive channel